MALMGRQSVPLTREVVQAHDVVLISTDHDAVDYASLLEWSELIVDTRNVFARRGLSGAQIVKA